MSQKSTIENIIKKAELQKQQKLLEEKKDRINFKINLPKNDSFLDTVLNANSARSSDKEKEKGVP